MNRSFIKQSALCVVALLLCFQGVRIGKEVKENQSLLDSLVEQDNVIKSAVEDYIKTYSYDTEIVEIKIKSLENDILEAVVTTDSNVKFEVCGDLVKNKWEVCEVYEE